MDLISVAGTIADRILENFYDCKTFHSFFNIISISNIIWENNWQIMMRICAISTSRLRRHFAIANKIGTYPVSYLLKFIPLLLDNQAHSRDTKAH